MRPAPESLPRQARVARPGRVRAGLFAVGLVGLVGLVGSARADGEPVVARVGTREITVADLERRLARTAPFQLAALGATPEAAKRGVLEQVLVRDALLAEGARAERLHERPDVAERLRAALRAATLADVRAEVLEKNPVTDAEVKAYYEANRAKFVSPERLALWRILTKTREEAKAILDSLGKDPSVKHWNELAREKSIDKTSNMRGGNLGFVAADGSTSEPGVSVPPALVAAARAVKDGEFVPEPIPEGDAFAVVWKRQTLRAVDRPLELEAPAIRQALTNERVAAKVTELLERLRKAHVVSSNPEVVDLLEVRPNGDIEPTRRPGTLPASRRPAAASPAPVKGPSGLR